MVSSAGASLVGAPAVCKTDIQALYIRLRKAIGQPQVPPLQWVTSLFGRKRIFILVIKHTPLGGGLERSKVGFVDVFGCVCITS